MLGRHHLLSGSLLGLHDGAAAGTGRPAWQLHSRGLLAVCHCRVWWVGAQVPAAYAMSPLAILSTTVCHLVCHLCAITNGPFVQLSVSKPGWKVVGCLQPSLGVFLFMVASGL